MKIQDQMAGLTKEERKIAMESIKNFNSIIDKINTHSVAIEIKGVNEKIEMPISAFKFLGNVLRSMSESNSISFVPISTELSTQDAAELLGCSRPHIVKILEEGEIEYKKVGKHRRIKYDDLIEYQKKMKENQKQNLIKMMRDDEEVGLYGSE